ncbi:hypothetical protein CC2G_012697 [Coprinopsis cinerea AmutBmut pab1-1]|nr:hypothetical protein CC2G_012697 [Coprinopsis cinerea AmutBmut pab1-1]
MPCIYGRFMEKEARQWRQIYKSLQLLEYLVKNGSERVVDDARSHIATLKMLRSFHYIDDKGKDEGINVRNRAKELVELLSDVEKIRAERRKAKANKSKFIGVGNDGFGMSGGSRYGGFGSDSLGGASSWNDHYSSGGGSSYAGRSSYNDSSSSRRQYEEYDAGGDEIRSSSSNTRSNSVRTAPKKAAPSPPPPAPAPVVDLLGGFDDDDGFGAPATAPVAAPAPPATNKALPMVSLDDDDFSDFQPAPVAHAAQPAAPAPAPAAAAAAKPNLMDLLSQPQARPASTPLAQPAVQAQPPPGFGQPLGGHRPTPSLSAQPSQFAAPIGQVQSQPLFGGVPLAPTTNASSPAARPGSTPAAAPSKPASSANFDDLWSLSLGSASKSSSSSGAPAKSIQDLQKEKAMAGIWGGGSATKPAGAAQQPAFPAFGGSSTTNNTSSSGGADDLLL